MNYSPSRPSLFPCATQVSLIQVGADDGHGDLKAQGQDHFQYLKHVGKNLLNKTKEEQDKVTRPVIQSVSAGLSFTEEVCVIVIVNVMLKYLLICNTPS